MDENKIKDILRNREQKLAYIRTKMIQLYKETDWEAALTEAALPPINPTGMPGGSCIHKDLGNVLLRWEKVYYNNREEILKLMCELTEREDEINRVWACFHALDEQYFNILNELYVKGQLYDTVEAGYGKSHKTFENHRKKAIRQLIEFYESGESVAGLMYKYRNKLSKEEG